MKTIIIMATLAILSATTANAQQRPAAASGMSGAEGALLAKGNVKGADRIARARCFSGMGACNAKYAKQRAQAMQARGQR